MWQHGRRALWGRRVIPIRKGKLPTAGILSYLYQRSPTHKHRGIDLPAPKGTPVYAARAGRVEHANDRWRSGFSGYGRNVVIAHPDGTFSFYAHLEGVLVTPGQAVAEGQPVGTVGNSVFTREDRTRESGGPHLHFEASATPYPKGSEDDRLDPIAWLREASEAVAEGARKAAPPLSRSRSSECPHCGGPVELVRVEREDPTPRDPRKED